MLVSLVNTCRNKAVKSVISPTVSLVEVTCFQVYGPDGVDRAAIWGASSVDVSVSAPSITSEYDTDSRTFTHSFSCSFQSFQPHILQWCKDFAEVSHRYCLCFSKGADKWVIGLEGLSFTYSSDGDSVTAVFKSISSYNPMSFKVYEPEPIRTYLHIQGRLDKTKLSGNGGFTFNGTAYYYDDIEADSDGYFDIAVEEPVTMHSFSAEWAFVDQSPLMSVDLSDFTGHNDVTDLSAAFKGNANLEYVRIPDMPSVTTYEECFSGCASLTSVSMTTDFSNVVSFRRMFAGCSSLPRFDFGHEYIETSPDVSCMFQDCAGLQEVSFTYLSTVSNIDHMLDGCAAIHNVNLFNKVWAPTSANFAFAGCTSLQRLYLWGMDSEQVTPGEYSSSAFFPADSSALIVAFHPTHAHGYDVTMLNDDSLDSYIRTLADVPASLAGNKNMAVMTSAQYAYIQSIPSLVTAYNKAVNEQGWTFSFR